MAELGLSVAVVGEHERILQAVQAALKEEGFGVLTEIDVQQTLRTKLDVDFRKYRILGACNPPLAHKALSAELQVGLMMPCNVVVYEERPGRSIVLAVDPLRTMAADNPGLRPIAEEVRVKLQRVLARLTPEAS